MEFMLCDPDGLCRHGSGSGYDEKSEDYDEMPFEYDANLSQFDWFPASSGLQTDFFFAWKMIAIVILGVVMIGIMLYRYLKKKEQFQFENSFYMLFVYAMFVAMSALFSSYKYWVVRGTYELFEPVWAVFAYMILCYYVYNYVQEEKQVKASISIDKTRLPENGESKLLKEKSY